MDPFDIFPVKVWEEILDRLGDPQDKVNLINASPAFQLLDLFQDKGTEWHFSAILPFVLGHLYRPPPCPWQQNKPWHRQGALKSAVLNCRLASKGILTSVDNFVDFYWNKYSAIPPFTAPDHFNSLEHVERCLAHADQLGNPRRSPFIGGGLLHLHCGENTNFPWEERTLPPLLTALELVSHPNIGNNLQGIRIMINFRVDDLQGTHNFVNSLLQLVPNVRTIVIGFFPVGNVQEAEEVETAHFPELPRLRHLEFDEFIYTAIERSLIRDCLTFNQYFEQLTYLEIKIFLWKEEYNNGVVQFPHLRTILVGDIPLTGWKNTILDIIGNLNAPVLECFRLETEDFNVFQLSQEQRSFDNFVYFRVHRTISESRANEIWRRRRSSSRSATGEVGGVSCAYIFYLDSQ